MSAITWLHISDLHWKGSTSYEQNMVAQKLLDDLRRRQRFAPELARIDLIFVTGDVAFQGQAEEYRLAERFFCDLLQVTGVRRQHLFIVPGNHDVDRSLVDPAVSTEIAALSDHNAVDNMLGGPRWDTVMRRFRGYRDWVNRFFWWRPAFGPKRYCYAQKLNVSGHPLIVLGLNSAWASATVLGHDQTNLFLGRKQANGTHAAVHSSPKSICIALMHHPFGWLREFDQQGCEELLLPRCHFVLHGHRHRTHVERRQGPGFDTIVIDAGSFYEAGAQSNAYKLVSYDPPTGETTIYLRRYSQAWGGFYYPDPASYPDVHGRYTIRSFRSQSVISNGHQIAPATSMTPGEPPIMATARTLVQWWKNRGFASDPFAWPNANDVASDDLATLYPLWYIDPSMEAEYQGLGLHPTLEAVESRDTGSLVLVYGSAGSGKTFYRRVAAERLRRDKQRVVVIRRTVSSLAKTEQLTADQLAQAICGEVCGQLLGRRAHLPAKATAGELLDHCERVCQDLLRRNGGRVYIFLDDLGKFLDEVDAPSPRDETTLGAFVEFFKAVIRAAPGERPSSLALRIFVPAELQPIIESKLGADNCGRVISCPLAWTPEHCLGVAENRLASCKKKQGAERSLLSQLLSDNVQAELERWLKKPARPVSPRATIALLAQLAQQARKDGIGTDQIGLETWKRALASWAGGRYSSRGQGNSWLTSLSQWISTAGKAFLQNILRVLGVLVRVALVLAGLLGLLLGVVSPGPVALKSGIIVLSGLILVWVFAGAPWRVKTTGNWLYRVIRWVADTKDFVGALLLIAGFVACVLFFMGRLANGTQDVELPDVDQFLQDSWDTLQSLAKRQWR